MKHIDEPELLTILEELITRPSENPPGKEEEVAEYLRERLNRSSVAFEVETYDVETSRPNVMARAGNPAKGTVLLTGHMDVVPTHPEDWSGDPYKLRERDGRVIGRGTSDMKGALAAKVLAAETYLEQTQEPGEVVLGFVVDEEDKGKGTRAMVERGIDADVAIIGEPTELQVCVAQKGVVRYKVTVRGESGHSGRPDDAVNAIEGMNRILNRIESLDDRLREETTHALLAPETVTVTEIKGGIAPNVVPDTVTATIDWRFHPGTSDPEPFDRTLREVIDGVTVDGNDVSVEIDRTVFARGAEVPPDQELVTLLQDAAARAGFTADAVGFNAATDARFIVNDANIPTVLFGPGSIESDAHTVDESIRVDDLKATVATYRSALEGFLS